MSDQPISRYPVPDIEDVPEDIRNVILEVQQQTGFVPNVFLALARRPEEFRAFFAYHNSLMDKESGLTLGEREMVIVVTSSLNNCLYCVVVHGAILRIREKNPTIADQLATNYRKADITPRQRAMLDFAAKVTTSSFEVDESDYEALHAHDFSDEDIWDITALASLYGFSNRMANSLNVRPNDEFYLMGRVPPDLG
jgi:uncharacterized peroxidase-related enzyme